VDIIVSSCLLTHYYHQHRAGPSGNMSRTANSNLALQPESSKTRALKTYLQIHDEVERFENSYDIPFLSVLTSFWPMSNVMLPRYIRRLCRSHRSRCLATIQTFQRTCDADFCSTQVISPLPQSFLPTGDSFQGMITFGEEVQLFCCIHGLLGSVFQSLRSNSAWIW